MDLKYLLQSLMIMEWTLLHIIQKTIHIYYEIQVKSIRDCNYAFVTKDKMKSLSGGELPANRLVCLLRFENEKHPEVYIIPAKAWEKPDDLLK